jgi:ribosomal protein S18 acetylase RimI-like enzyme
MKLHIRQAVKADAPSLARLQQKWFEEANTHGFVPERQQQIETAPDSYRVADFGGKAVGFISCSVLVSEGTAVIPAGESYLNIDNLYVLPEFRNRGIGSSLISQSLAQAKQQGVSYALVYSAAKNIKDILQFYERHHFQSWYVQMFQKL